MTAIRLCVAAATTALLAGCGFMGPDYPTFGESEYRLEGTASPPDGGAPVRTVIYRDGAKMRVETVLPNYGQATVVFDQATDAAYVLTAPTAPAAASVPAAAPAPANPAAPGAAPAPTANPAAAPGAAAVAPATPTTVAPAPGAVAVAPPPVSGIAVRIADANAPQPMETAWAALGEDNARPVGECEVAGEQGHEWRPRENTQGIERIACITDDGIVLRLRENDQVLFEATNLQRGDQDDTLFGVPPGYQVIDPEAVAERIGDTMEQLDSVTGAAPAAPGPTAPAPTPAPRG